MRSAVKQSPYISAYPLKVLEDAAKSGNNNQSPYLKALLSGQATTVTRIRVSPMVNPYQEKFSIEIPLRIASSLRREPEGKEWFNHYE